MKTLNFNRFLNNLSTKQKSELLNLLKKSLASVLTIDIKLCPCCNKNQFVKNGSYKGVQKYRCQLTKKNFTYKTNTIISGLIKTNGINELINLLGKGNLPTVSEIQKKLHISRQTAFDWRTKILSALYNNVNLDNQVIEFDETNHYLSRKGRNGLDSRFTRKRGSRRGVGDNKYNVKIFMSYSRSAKKLNLYVSHLGKTNTKDIRNYFSICDNPIIYCDGHKSYSKYFKDNNVKFYSFKSSDFVSEKNNDIHNQTLNYFTGKLKNYLNKYHKGVSTKYLQNYCNWISFITNFLKKGVKPNEIIMNNKVALSIHKQKEKEFGYLLKNSGRSNFGTYKERYKLSA